MAYSDVAIDLSTPAASQEGFLPFSPTDDDLSYGGEHGRMSRSGSGYTGLMKRNETDKSLLWAAENAEPDDYLHDPNPELDKYLDKQLAHWSFAGIVNTFTLAAIVIVLVGLFGGWPIYRYVIDGGFPTTEAVYTNNPNTSSSTTGVPNMPTLIDATTPDFAKTRTGFDGDTYNLVFSDEFNTSGRTFWPGDDPYWTAVDLHYWATTDLEWYDPDAIVTKDGYLEITLTEQETHGLNFRSGMLQSWNKFCFTGGYIEMGVILPGKVNSQGLWPALWTMGNLGRPGYGGSVDGMWPYTYDSCDVGTLPNQTNPDGLTPTAAKTSGDKDYGGELSYLSGQRASACTCAADSDEHPGPKVTKGRGAPEIDILEAQVAYPASGTIGSASQSIQVAPFDAGHNWLNTTPYTVTYDTALTTQNQWHGSISQESMSLNTQTDRTSYEGSGATQTTYGFEYTPGADGHITWAINETATWTINADAMGPNAEADIGQRLIAEEPMAIVMNLAISTKFQEPLYQLLTFPVTFRIDYVRVWQKEGQENVGCDPKDFPTSDYINNHPDIYNNPNITVFTESNYTKPRNSLAAGGCS